jgi:hypothetical protein
LRKAKEKQQVDRPDGEKFRGVRGRAWRIALFQRYLVANADDFDTAVLGFVLAI